VALLVAHAASSATKAPVGSVKPVQELAALLAPHGVHAVPARSSRILRTVESKTPLTQDQALLPVLGHAKDAAGRGWLRVRLPGRPNGGSGWIERAGTTRRTSPWHLVIDLSQRTVVAYWRGTAVQTFSAVVGKPASPTPQGEFFVEESLELGSGTVGAPFALALSARSTVYQEFEGGPGQIALHGTSHVGGVPGTAVSHGCVRLPAGEITWLAAHIKPGDPVTIRG
jgi:L,D-transpeptidase catalytic domain